jgi:CheY-like chemotaxis protein
MSHEMRTPLNAMLGFAQLIKLEPFAGPQTHAGYIGHILQAGQHLLALINDVLDLQRVEEGRFSLDVQPVELHRIVNTCVDLLAPQTEALSVQFECLVESGIFVLADPRRLRQVFLNIGSNAVKYNRPGGMVRWHVDFVGIERISICIEDEGAGMTAEQAERLFQPFERLGKETSTIEGTGLGLIIARSLVEEMGGTLELRSRRGVGTKVTIELPRHLAMATDPSNPWPHEAHDDSVPLGLAAIAAIPSPGGGAPLRLLYVEDNRINALLFEQAVTVHSNIELRIAEDGQQAIEIVQGWKPDVLVLDAHLPGMSGYEALQALRALPQMQSTPAYMCSADAMPEDLQRASEAGFVGYWTKPIDIAQVLTDLGRVANGLPHTASN